MDDAERTPSGIHPNAESWERAQAEEAIDPEKEWNELLEGWEGEGDPWTDMGMDVKSRARIHHLKEKGPRSMRQEEDGGSHTAAASLDLGRRRIESKMKF